MWKPGDPLPGTALPRVALVPRNEADLSSAPGPIPALALFQLRLRDTIDFTVDFSVWLAGNGGCTILDAVWEVAEASPQTPVVAGQTYSASGRCTVVLQVAGNAKPGDAYWLDLTVDVSASAPIEGDTYVIPPRTLTRRIHVVVVEG